jgi:hypothetical protein
MINSIKVNVENGQYLVKLADFGLSRITLNYYESGTGMKAWQWAAVESLWLELYSTASDYWLYWMILTKILGL